ncbi:hypothetical protein [Natrinema halophilum]|uniref:Uncharacterized protein n=1 Tax=Natrinema halophilum TaxID=1699371 RepID=A0A7D5K5S5_9EURY|nr:hypothetical protein [Natrinema halophilum]QLG48623.1 hypothetical protein HYG82_07070 [Natrinema halophilum]
MLPNDSRGLETLDRRDASPDLTARDRTETRAKPAHRVRLEAIDAAVQGLLVDVRRLRRNGVLEGETGRDVEGRLHEIRSEAVSIGRLIGTANGETDHDGAGSSGGEIATEADACGTDSDAVPMVTRRGGGVLSVLGPAPSAFERERADHDT